MEAQCRSVPLQGRRDHRYHHVAQSKRSCPHLTAGQDPFPQRAPERGQVPDTGRKGHRWPNGTIAVSGSTTAEAEAEASLLPLGAGCLARWFGGVWEKRFVELLMNAWLPYHLTATPPHYFNKFACTSSSSSILSQIHLTTSNDAKRPP